MLIYIVFKGSHYYPYGGWDDHLFTFFTRELAESAASQLEEGQWSHVVEFNTETLEGVVVSGYGRGFGDELGDN